MKPIIGSWVDHPDRIQTEKAISALKLSKLQARAHKHRGKSATTNQIFNHFYYECLELFDAIYDGDNLQILRELADISNLVDMLYYSYSN